jgi:deoxyribose-phosphate aldolase
MNKYELASHIDHTLLKPDAKESDIIKLCKEALEHKFASVCVNASFVKLAYSFLQGTEVRVCTVAGFPLGATTKETKAFEAAQAIKDGAKVNAVQRAADANANSCSNRLPALPHLSDI